MFQLFASIDMKLNIFLEASVVLCTTGGNPVFLADMLTAMYCSTKEETCISLGVKNSAG